MILDRSMKVSLLNLIFFETLTNFFPPDQSSRLMRATPPAPGRKLSLRVKVVSKLRAQSENCRSKPVLLFIAIF